MPAPEAPHIPATADEELLCCLGLGYPDFADRDPERVARIRDEVAYGFAAMADVAQAVSIFGMNHPGFRAHLLLWEGWHDAKQVRPGGQDQGGPAGSGTSRRLRD